MALRKEMHASKYSEGFKLKFKNKYEIEKYIATKNNDLKLFYKKWIKTFPI